MTFLDELDSEFRQQLSAKSDENNPYLEAWQQAGGQHWSPDYRHDLRGECIKVFGFAVPNAEAIAAIAALSPIVEIGAGTGYWAWMLRNAGVDVIAYDKQPVVTGGTNPFGFQTRWTDIAPGMPPVLKQ